MDCGGLSPLNPKMKKSEENMLFFGCKHDWKVLSETVTKSPFEVAMEATRRYDDSAGIDRRLLIPYQMCYTDRKHIQVVTCSKCGSIKQWITNLK